MGNIVLVLRINDLMHLIPQGIEKKFKDDENGKTDMEKQYRWIVDGIRLGVNLTKILTELKELNDQIFPPHGRKRDLDVMVAQAVNKKIRNTPMHQDMISTLSKKKEEGQLDQEQIYLENFDINGLVRNLDKMVNVLKANQKNKKLTSIERQIIKTDEIDGDHVIKIFFANLLQRAQLGRNHSLYPIFQDLEAHLIAAFNNYVQAMSQKGDIRNVPQVVYVDFVSKFNLMEFFRFSDGAHCCLASDPKVSSQYGAGIYGKQIPRYLTNATSFWWQFTTDVRSGKQVGWFENWFGLDENDGDKVFVRTELTYLAPGTTQDRDLQMALLAQVERILFSTKVTKVAQATGENSDHHASNALSPPVAYQEETMKVFKLQSLRDGSSIYEDAPMATNVTTTRKFRVKNNPGDVEVEATVEKDRYDVSAEFVQPSDITEKLIERLVEIEEKVFLTNKRAGKNYLRYHFAHPQGVSLIVKDEDTEKIVGYMHSVPSKDAQLMPQTSEYKNYRSEEVLYVSDFVILDEYRSKTKMVKLIRSFARQAKEKGYKLLAAHTETTNSIHLGRQGHSLSHRLQRLGFEVKKVEPDWAGTGDQYDFLVLDLSKVDNTLRGDVADSPIQEDLGGIDLAPDKWELKTEGDNTLFNAPINPQILKNISSSPIDGLTPIILQITPTNFQFLLGLNTSPCSSDKNNNPNCADKDQAAIKPEEITL